MDTREKNIFEFALDELTKEWNCLDHVKKQILSYLQNTMGIDPSYAEVAIKAPQIDEHRVKNAVSNAVAFVQYILPMLGRGGGYVALDDEYRFVQMMFPAYPESFQKLLAHDLSVRNKEISRTNKMAPFAAFVEILYQEDM